MPKLSLELDPGTLEALSQMASQNGIGLEKLCQLILTHFVKGSGYLRSGDSPSKYKLLWINWPYMASVLDLEKSEME